MPYLGIRESRFGREYQQRLVQMVPDCRASTTHAAIGSEMPFRKKAFSFRPEAIEEGI
ncbi:hypothetical protein [Pseudorhizobium flavum]|uniref:Uncharacterized protein n=1 Tax=Pseudorhizobium flavum TaxID=1335061 RepID=A0A7W9YWW5_9HYPH|nr:hypothetical protein [Pseudorhizobium flavum]MBB6179844.1 hypothetical protein [Pseudorhizobium flavum]